MANSAQIIDDIISKLLELKKSLSSQPLTRKPLQNNVIQTESSHVLNLTDPPKTDPQPQQESYNTFESLKNALNSPKWASAIPDSLICPVENESEKLDRGQGIIEFFLPDDITGLKFLDAGCGEGHCAYAAITKNAKFSMGYDIKNKFSQFEPRDNFALTTDFSLVKECGPYDVILIYDVIDHIEKEDPVEFLKKIGTVLTPGGKIHVRFHPFISRHGGHLYQIINKAYLHLVFTPEELQILMPGYFPEPNFNVIYPINTYQSLINKSGLTLVQDFKKLTESVEPFFKIPKIAERIMANTNTTSFPEFQMSIQFVDVILTKK